MEVPPGTRYVSRRGKSFAYQAFGHGSRALVAFLEAPFHLDLLWTDPYWVERCSRLADSCRVVLFQQMGLGLSDSIDLVPTLEEQASDVAAVMDTEEIGAATLFGIWSTNMTLALLAAQQPERVEAMVLLLPYAQGYYNVGFDQTAGFTASEAESLERIFERAFSRWGEGLTIDFWDPVIADRNRRVWGMLERSAATPSAARAMYEAASHADVRAVLPQVQVPTRVLRHPTSTVPEQVGRVVAELVPNATFHELPRSEPYMTVIESLGSVFDHLEEVVVGSHRLGSVDRQVASILFTDVVSSTERLAQLGDGRWGDILRRHEAQLRHQIDAEGGRLVKMIGDGSMSAFGGPAAAIRTARAVGAGAHELGIELRAGIHAGECNRRPDGDLSGLAVHVAARVAAAARPGEVWVSRTARDLIGGSGLQLSSRGSYALKGLNDEWELFSVIDEDEEARSIPAEPSPLRTSDRLTLAAARHTPRLVRGINRIANISARRLARRT